MKKLPFVLEVDYYSQNQVEKLVEQILIKKSQNEIADTIIEEQNIDTIIYKIYGISSEKIIEIENGLIER